LGQHAKYPFTLEDGRKVGGTPKKRGTLFKVQFRDPVEPKYREAATGVVVPKGWTSKKRPPDAWFDEAGNAIQPAYAPPSSGPGCSTTTVTWDEAEALVLACFERDGSKRTYHSSFRLIRRAFPDLPVPAALDAQGCAVQTVAGPVAEVGRRLLPQAERHARH
jgi:hypothetical protein